MTTKTLTDVATERYQEYLRLKYLSSTDHAKYHNDCIKAYTAFDKSNTVNNKTLLSSEQLEKINNDWVQEFERKEKNKAKNAYRAQKKDAKFEELKQQAANRGRNESKPQPEPSADKSEPDVQPPAETVFTFDGRHFLFPDDPPTDAPTIHCSPPVPEVLYCQCIEDGAFYPAYQKGDRFVPVNKKRLKDMLSVKENLWDEVYTKRKERRFVELMAPDQKYVDKVESDMIRTMIENKTARRQGKNGAYRFHPLTHHDLSERVYSQHGLKYTTPVPLKKANKPKEAPKPPTPKSFIPEPNIHEEVKPKETKAATLKWVEVAKKTPVPETKPTTPPAEPKKMYELTLDKSAKVDMEAFGFKDEPEPEKKPLEAPPKFVMKGKEPMFIKPPADEAQPTAEATQEQVDAEPDEFLRLELQPMVITSMPSSAIKYMQSSYPPEIIDYESAEPGPPQVPLIDCETWYALNNVVDGITVRKKSLIVDADPRLFIWYPQFHVCLPKSQPDSLARFQAINYLRARQPTKPAATFCMHEPEQCDCHEFEDAHLFYNVHVWHGHLTRLILKVPRLFAYCFDYKQPIAHFVNGSVEGLWRDGQYHLKTLNNDKELVGPIPIFLYKHQLNDGNGCVVWTEYTKAAQTTIYLFTPGSTRVDNSVPEAAIEFNDAIHSRSGVKEVDLRATMATETMIGHLTRTKTVKVQKAISFFNIILCTTEANKTFVVPKEAVDAARNAIAGKARDPHNFQTLLTQCKSICRRFNHDPGAIANAVFYTAVIAFQHDVDDEIEALWHLQTQNEKLTRHNTLLSFKSDGLHHITYATAAKYTVLAFVSAILLANVAQVGRRYAHTTLSKLFNKVTGPRLAHIIYNAAKDTDVPNIPPPPVTTVIKQIPVQFSTFPVHVLYSYVLKASELISDRLVEILENVYGYVKEKVTDIVNPTNPETGHPPWLNPATDTITSKGRTFWTPKTSEAIGAKVFNHGLLYYHDHCNINRLLTKTSPTAQVSTAASQVCSPKPGLLQVGPAVLGLVPVISRVCQHNEMLAINNRCLTERPPFDKAAWSEFSREYKKLYTLEESEYMKNGQLHEPEFEDWLKRFPVKRREQLREGRIAYYEIGKAAANIINKCFEKREPVLKCRPEGIEDYEPRLIQGRLPTYQAMTGPITYAATKHLSHIWGARNNQCMVWKYGKLDYVPGTEIPMASTKHVTYTGGLSAEALGILCQAEVEYVSAKSGNYAIYESDVKRMDGGYWGAAIDIVNATYKWAQVPKGLLDILGQQRSSKGVTSLGNFFTDDGRLKSGEGNTTETNTKTNITIQHLALIKCETTPPPKSRSSSSKLKITDRVSIKGQGDDGHNVMARGDVSRFMAKAREVWNALGWQIEDHVFHDVIFSSYLSGRFYRIGPNERKFGPKIGRIMAKTFYAKRHYSQHNAFRWLRAVVDGLMKETAFIPVLRVVFRKLDQMLSSYAPLKLPYEEKVRAERWDEASPETFEDMCILYDLSPGDIEGLEKFIEENMTQPTCTIAHPILDRIIAVDCPDKDAKPAGDVSHLYAQSPFSGIALLCAMFLSNTIIGMFEAQFGVEQTSFIRVGCLWAPICEELFKSYAPQHYRLHASIAFGLCESLAKIDNGASMWAVIAPTLLHVGTGLLQQHGSFTGAVALHMGYNSVVACLSYGLLTSDALDAQSKEALTQNLLQNTPYIVSLDYLCQTVFIQLPSWIFNTSVRMVRFLFNSVNKAMHSLNGNTTNYKGAVLEKLTKLGVRYPTAGFNAYGTANCPTFTCTLTPNDRSKVYQAIGSTKKEAELKSYKLYYEDLIAGKVNNPEQPPTQSDKRVAEGVPYRWDFIYIDADQYPRPFALPLADRVHVVGVAGNIRNWEGTKFRVGPVFINVTTMVVPAFADSADNLITALIHNEDPPAIGLLYTNDRKFIERVRTVEGVYCYHATNQPIWDFSLRKLVRLCGEFSPIALSNIGFQGEQDAQEPSLLDKKTGTSKERIPETIFNTPPPTPESHTVSISPSADPTPPLTPSVVFNYLD